MLQLNYIQFSINNFSFSFFKTFSFFSAHLNVFEPIDTPPTSNDPIEMDFTNEFNRFSSLAAEFKEKTSLNDSDLLSTTLKRRKRIRKRKKRKSTVDCIETYNKVFCVEPEQQKINVEVQA